MKSMNDMIKEGKEIQRFSSNNYRHGEYIKVSEPPPYPYWGYNMSSYFFDMSNHVAIVDRAINEGENIELYANNSNMLDNDMLYYFLSRDDDNEEAELFVYHNVAGKNFVDDITYELNNYALLNDEDFFHREYEYFCDEVVPVFADDLFDEHIFIINGKVADKDMIAEFICSYYDGGYGYDGDHIPYSRIMDRIETYSIDVEYNDDGKIPVYIITDKDTDTE